MQQYGNTTSFNIENVLTQNIINSDYFRRQCIDKKTWEELVDEIYDNVTDVEPWMSGNARGPSSAFCLVYRLAQIKPTVDQVNETIKCTDSPYIRAVSARRAALHTSRWLDAGTWLAAGPASELLPDSESARCCRWGFST